MLIDCKSFLFNIVYACVVLRYTGFGIHCESKTNPIFGLNLDWHAKWVVHLEGQLYTQIILINLCLPRRRQVSTYWHFSLYSIGYNNLFQEKYRKKLTDIDDDYFSVLCFVSILRRVSTNNHTICGWSIKNICIKIFY